MSRRDFYEEKFTIKYSNTINYNGSYAYEFDYKPFNIDKYAAEFLDDDGEPALSVYYYDKKGRMQFLDGNYYDLDLNNHRIILKPEIYGGVDLNPITDRSINKDIRDFYVSFVPSGSDAEFGSYRFTYDPNGKLKNTLSVNYWSVAGGSRADVVPNFNAYYFANDKESSYNNMVGHASQILAFVENGNSLMFDIEGELSAYDNGELLEGIRSGKYLALHIDANIRNCESLEKLLIKLYNSSGVFSTQDITPEELLMYDFNVKIDLPSKTNTLKSVEIVPIFRESALYSADNTVGVPNFEFEEWDEEATFFDSDGNKFMKVPLDNELKTDTSLNLAYIFNEDFESLSLPDGVDFGWDTVEDEFGVVKSYVLLVPNTFKDPKNNSKTISFKEGDSFVIRYNSPVEKAISIGIGTMYFQKKPYGYKSDLPIAEVLLVNAENSSDYSEYTRDYFAQLPLRLTPFDTEISNTFKDVKISLNLSEFTDFAIDGEIAFSDIIVSVPYPNYELSLDQFMIQKEGRGTSLEFEEINENVWQFSEKETYTSSNSPANDTYYFKPPANIFGGQISWPDYAKIYDEHYNYYRAGTEGDENQLLWANDKFYWNPSFDRFQEYWGAQIELPMTADPRTELYFEYCTQDSWKTPISLDYGNIDFSSLEVIFDLEHFLTPKYEKWYDITVENANYDYKIVQYYEESFSVYSAANEYTYEFELEYDLRDDFKNLSLYSVVGLTPTFEDCVIRDDGVNYEINLDLINKSITIIDKNPEDGSLSKFDLITVIFNFSNGPISSRSEIILSDEFREKYLSDAESTFYSYLSISFQYAVMEGDILFYEDYETITTEMTSFESIGYTRNDVLGSNFKIPGYDSELFINFRLYYDDSNVIYVADIDNDGEKDYKQIIDFNKDGKVDVIKYGINDPENRNEIIWHTIIQQFETSEIYVNKSSSEEKWTKWFDIKDAEFASYSYALGDVFDLSGVKLKNINDFFNIFGTIIENFAAIFIPDVDFWARKSIQTQSTEKRSVNYGYYGVKIDSDRDGYPDKSVQYEKTDVVAEYTAINREKVLLAGKRQTILTKIDDFISRNMESFFEGTPEDKVFNNKLTEDKLDNKRGTGYLKSSYRKFTKTSTVSYVKEYCSEQITISDYSEGRIEEQRIYKDDFDSGERLADEGTYPVRNLITRALQDVPSVPELSKTDPSDGSWDAETWGVDDVPVKFDALTKISMGKRQTENAFERTIKLVIPNRFSVYHDFYKSSKENALGSTEIEVSGVFITPPGGQVYFSSDKELFKKVKSKTKGHYFYYDSDDNGFYETVYVLAPSSDGEKYDVIAIGYSYDGDHDFAPYDNLNYKVESETTFDQIKKETLKFDRWSYHFGDLEEMELLFPEDFDGYQARDSIFEVWKLIEKSTQNKRYPLLFDEVRRRTYRNIMNVYREQMWADVGEQVFMTITASTVSTLVQVAVTGILSASVVLAPIAVPTGKLAGIATYIAIYTLMTKYFIDEKLRHSVSTERAFTFYAESPLTKSKPTAINERAPMDRILKDSMPAALMGHPGAYYTTVVGGPPGNSYTAEAIVTPRNALRSFNVFGNIAGTIAYLISLNPDNFFGLDFDYLNLDYLLLNSELYSYIDRKYYYYETGDGLDAKDLEYAQYSKNNLGYLQFAIKDRSGGKFNAIKATCVDGVPRYIFINKDSNKHELTLPLTHLYSPVILAEDRYDDLDVFKKEGHLIIDVKCDYAKSTKGIDPSIMKKEEANLYAAKIKLASDSFSYPISEVYVDVMAGGLILDTVEVSSDRYDVDGGNLFFYESLEDLSFESEEKYEDLVSGFENHRIYYKLHLKFKRFAADDGSDEYNRLALVQATMYSIQEYFNQYYFAKTSAEMISEIGYTEVMTLISTAIAAPAAALGSWAVMGLSKYIVQASLKQILAQIARESWKSVLREVYEEIVLDGLIEALVENVVDMIPGTTDDMAFWISSFLTSVRESGSDVGRAARGEGVGVDFQQQYALEVAAQKEAGGTIDRSFKREFRRKMEQQSELSVLQKKQEEEEKRSWKELVKTGFLKLLTFGVSGMFFGSLNVYAAYSVVKSYSNGITASVREVSESKARLNAYREARAYDKGMDAFLEKVSLQKSLISGEEVRSLYAQEFKGDLIGVSVFARLNPNPIVSTKVPVDIAIIQKLGALRRQARSIEEELRLTEQDILAQGIDVLKEKIKVIGSLAEIRAFCDRLNDKLKINPNRFTFTLGEGLNLEKIIEKYPKIYRRGQDYKFRFRTAPAEVYEEEISIPLPLDFNLEDAEKAISKWVRAPIFLFSPGTPKGWFCLNTAFRLRAF
ncbi:MAG: hypothetical protein ACTSPD_18025 [Promethearchaeota archaeon]